MLNRRNGGPWGSLPVRWRYVLVALIPFLVTGAVSLFIGLWAIAVGFFVALVLAIWAGIGQRQILGTMALDVLRLSAAEKGERTALEVSHEEARLSRAINRFADNVERTIEDERANRIHHENILNEMNDGVLVVNSQGLLEYSNEAARRILDFEDGQDDDSPVLLASRVNIFDINDASEQTMGSQQVFRRTVELYNPLRYLEVVATPLRPGNTEGGRALLIVRDRTGEYRLGESMREFIANASHELRTPIAAIQASVETLKLGAINDPQASEDFLERIGTSTEKMARLVSDLMDLTLLESGRVSMHLAPIEPNELVDSVIGQFEPIANRKGITLRAQSNSSLPLINVDKEQIERVLENLVSNALKFTPDKGFVTMKCRSEDSVVVFSVEDSGSGIDVDELPHVFERFYKSTQRTSQQDGFGLGLAIARNIVEMHQGEIEARSILGQGSTFSVKLPIA